MLIFMIGWGCLKFKDEKELRKEFKNNEVLRFCYMTQAADLKKSFRKFAKKSICLANCEVL